MSQPPILKRVPQLGVLATVVCDHETHGPTTLNTGRSLREVSVFPGPSERFFSEMGYRALKAKRVDNWVLPMNSKKMEEPLVDNVFIVSAYTLHVALYALQNPTPEYIVKALEKIGVSGDCDEHSDNETLLPLPVSKPPGWGR
jgi:hypothetical protein